MSFGGGGGSSSIATSTDVALSNPGDGQVLAYNGTLQKWQNTANPGAADASTISKGVVQLAGDLGGTAAAPTVPGLASKEPTITAGTTGQYFRGDKSWQTLDKIAVGLGSVDNTTDLNKPISTATQTALNAKADASTVGNKVLLIDNAAALPGGTPAGVVVVVKS